jgi:hypothetical protein
MGREIRNSKFTACGPFVYFVKPKKPSDDLYWRWHIRKTVEGL